MQKTVRYRKRLNKLQKQLNIEIRQRRFNQAIEIQSKLAIIETEIDEKLADIRSNIQGQLKSVRIVRNSIYQPVTRISEVLDEHPEIEQEIYQLDELIAKIEENSSVKRIQLIKEF